MAIGKQINKRLTDGSFRFPCSVISINVRPKTNSDSFTLTDVQGNTSFPFTDPWSSPASYPLDSPKATGIIITAIGTIDIIYYL